MYEGKLKYGRANWRAAPVKASVYVGAALRHLLAWFEGEDNAPESTLPHLGHALACLAILVDAKAHGTLIDDRQYGEASAYQTLLTSLLDVMKHMEKTHAGKDPKHWDRRETVRRRTDDEKIVEQRALPCPYCSASYLWVLGMNTCPNCGKVFTVVAAHVDET